MKEVSCRTFEALEYAVQQDLMSLPELIDGIDYPLEHLRNRNERIEWSTFCRLIENARSHLESEDFEELGASFTKTRSFRTILLIARIIYRPAKFLQWMQSMQREGREMFTCVTSESSTPTPNRFVLTLTLDDRLPDCPEFFLITKGTLQALPAMLGSAGATMKFTLQEKQATYDMYVPPREGHIQRFRRVAAAPFRGREVADELQESHELLLNRYAQLEEARALLDIQAERLRVAHEVNEALRTSLDVEGVAKAIAQSLFRELGLEGIEIALPSGALDGFNGLRERLGDTSATEVLRRTIHVHGQTLGELRLHLPGSADTSETIDFVLPSIAITILNALNYDALVRSHDELEDRVQHRTAALQGARDDLAASLHDLEKAQRTKERIFANINHEIRTPLAIMKLAAEQAEDSNDDAQVGRSLASIRENVRRLLRLVNGLLMLASTDANSLSLRRVRFDLADMLRREVEAWTPMAVAHQLTLSLSLSAGAPSVEVVADRDALVRAVGNLISNAMKFTPEGGSIVLEIETKNDEHIVRVLDTGIGIGEDFAARAFDRFSQGPEPLRPGERGTGIGLAIVDEIVRAHGGRVWASQRAGGGTAFTFTLPQSTAEALAPTRDLLHSEAPLVRAAPVANEVPPSAEQASAHRYCILIAEDEPELLDIMHHCLAAHFRVLCARDGVEALAMAKAHHPDLLVTDIGMPRIDGVELTRRFVALPENRAARALLVTAESSTASRLEAFEAGAVDYITKPFDRQELLARVRAQLAIRDVALRLHEQESLSAMGILGAGLAHDIRNPLNVIKNLVDPIRSKLSDRGKTNDEAILKMLAFIQESAERLEGISTSILALENPGEISRDSVHVRSMLGRAIRHTPGLESSQVDLECSGDAHCRGSAILLEQVIVNLLANGLAAGGEEGRLAVRATESDDELRILVCDEGPGVPTENLERIFAPLFSTRAPGEGVGLGLAISRLVAQRHGGSLRALNVESGAIFELTLPREHHDQ